MAFQDGTPPVFCGAFVVHMPPDRGRRMRRVVRLFGLLCCAFLGATPVAAPLLHAQTSLVEEWRWVRFGVADGLPSPIVLDIARSGDGTIWAATQHGVVWYDGYRWQMVRDAAGRALGEERYGFVSAGQGREVYFVVGTAVFSVAARGEPARLLTPVAPGANWIDRVVRTSDGLWAATVRNGVYSLSRMANGKWHDEKWPAPPSQMFGPRLHRGAHGQLMLSVGSAVWERADGGWKRLLPFHEGTGAVVRFAFTPAGEESLVLKTAGREQGVWVRGAGANASGWSTVKEFQGEAPAAFDVGPDGSAVAILDAGDFLYSESSKWRRMLAPSFLATASAAAYDSTGDVWFATRAGVVFWRRKSQRWTQWRLSASSPVNRVNGLAVRSDGVVAAATAGGVAFLAPDGQLRPERGLPAVAFTTVAWDKNNELWAGSGGGTAGVYERTAHGWRLRTDAPGLGQAGVHRIVRGRDGSLWLMGLPFDRGTRGGLWRVAEGRIDAIALPPDVDGARFYDMVEDSTGARWFATERGLVRDIGGANDLKIVQTGAPHDLPWSLVAADDGGVWVGLRPSGPLHVRDDLSVEHPAATETFPTGTVTLHRHTDGRIWATSGDGIWVYSDSSWSTLTRSFGLPTQATWPLASSGLDLYVGTLGAGVFRLRTDELFNAHPRVALQEPSNEDTGLMLRWSVATERSVVAPEDVLSRWKLDNGRWSRWSHSTVGVARVWMPLVRHTLQVEARTPLGARSLNPELTTFTVPPPVWWRVGLLLPIGALLGVLVWLSMLLVRRRREQEALSLRVREAERMELVGSFAAGMAHELNNLLTTIIVNTELVHDDRPPGAEPSPAEEIRRAALQAAAQLRSVLTFTSDRSIVLGALDLAALLRQQSGPVSAMFPSTIEVTWNVPSEPMMVHAEPNAIAAILRALAEHALDAMTDVGRFDVTLTVRHLDARYRSELGLEAAPAHAALVLSHSGAGMTAEQSLQVFLPRFDREESGIGLPLVYGFMRRFHGAVQIDPSVTSGTTFRLYFPISAIAES